MTAYDFKQYQINKFLPFGDDFKTSIYFYHKRLKAPICEYFKRKQVLEPCFEKILI